MEYIVNFMKTVRVDGSISMKSTPVVLGQMFMWKFWEDANQDWLEWEEEETRGRIGLK